MKKRMLYLCSILSIILGYSCSNDDNVLKSVNSSESGEIMVRATLPVGRDSRIALTPNEDMNGKPIVDVAWDENDSFSVLKYGVESTLFSKSEAGDVFSGTLPEGGQGDFIGFYPPIINPNGIGWYLGERLSVNLGVQTGSLDKNMTYMVAKSEDGGHFVFRHLTALLKPSFDGLPSDISISRIVVGVSGTNVDGFLYETDEVLWENGNAITIDYETPVGIDTEFYVYLPPIEQNQLLTFLLTTTDGYFYCGKLNLQKDIVAGKLYTAEISLSKEIPYVTFSAGAEQTLTMSKAVNGMEYSVGENEWAELGTNTVTFGGNHGYLRLRGSNGTGTAESKDDFSQISFGNRFVPVDCFGDIRTLLYYINHTSVSSSGKFCSLFKDCTLLTGAPNLPATSLTDYCYDSMFEGCVILSKAPELPATVLKYGCYNRMFYGCSRLKSAPQLNATTLAGFCYYCMFADCTGLIEAPVLPAGKMEMGCYGFMFRGCTSLKIAPELPAMTLADWCYANMFESCSNLEKTPNLPATTLAPACYEGMFMACYKLTETPILRAEILEKNCYSYMFCWCKKLEKVTMLATDVDADDCMLSWLSNVPSSGTFYKNRNLNISKFTRDENGIPNGWTAQDYTY